MWIELTAKHITVCNVFGCVIRERTKGDRCDPVSE